MSGNSSPAPQAAVERALAAAHSDECVVIADETSSANLRWAGNTLTTNGVSRSRQLTVIAIRRSGDAAKVGVVSRAGVRDEQIPAIVAEAEDAAAEGTPAEDAQPLATQQDAAGIGAAAEWDGPPSGTEIGIFSRFAADLGDAFSAAASGGRKLYGFAEHQITSSFVGTSTGLRLRHDQPTGRVELNAKSADMARSAWAGAATRDFTGVDIMGLASGLAERLAWAKRTVDLRAGRYETLLPPTAVADLMIYLYWSAGAKDALDGRTVFSKPGGGTRVGEQLSAQPISLVSDPVAPRLECSPFVIAHASSRDSSVFDNGQPVGRTGWITAGRLTALGQTRHTAALSGLPYTPPIDNLIMEFEGSDTSMPEMISRTSRGLLLTCLWYIREVDPQTLLLTGLTRDGVYLVENGEVTGAVNNFRFNESPVAMLGRISEAGETEQTLPREWNDYFTRTAMPPLRIDGFNMSSVSQAS
ncbi:MAG TPA: metallopeptidase TldD-related protein [Streptosporangiaceae bacterium]|nr:metallopeptidase TldD-related protein [Streptosporangiaceae bacterium]